MPFALAAFKAASASAAALSLKGRDTGGMEPVGAIKNFIPVKFAGSTSAMDAPARS